MTAAVQLPSLIAADLEWRNASPGIRGPAARYLSAATPSGAKALRRIADE
jgi:hypothetical protein